MQLAGALCAVSKTIQSYDLKKVYPKAHVEKSSHWRK